MSRIDGNKPPSQGQLSPVLEFPHGPESLALNPTPGGQHDLLSLLGKLDLRGVVPAIVYGPFPGPVSKTFGLWNPAAPHLVTLFDTYPGLKMGPGNVVTTRTYDLRTQELSRVEQGWGQTFKVGKATIFYNIREVSAGGDVSGASGNFGVIAPPNVLRDYINKLPPGQFKKALELAVSGLGSGDRQVGLAFRFGVEKINGELYAVIGSTKVPLSELLQQPKGDMPLNFGHSSIAGLNQWQLYLGGNNPYIPTSDGRNHGNPVTNIANLVGELQKGMYPGAPPVKNNDEAARLILEAIRRDQHSHRMLPDGSRVPPLPSPAREALKKLLPTLHSYGLNLGSDEIKYEAENAYKRQPLPPVDPKTAKLVQSVFAGDYRTGHIPTRSILPPGLAETAASFLPGGSFVVAAADMFVNPQPVANEKMILDQLNVAYKGFEERMMKKEGGTLAALRLPSSAEYEGVATRLLFNELHLKVPGRPTGQAVYDAFKRLTPEERSSIARRIDDEIKRLSGAGSRHNAHTQQAGPEVVGYAGVPGLGQLEIQQNPDGSYTANGVNGSKYLLPDATTLEKAERDVRNIIKHGGVSPENLYPILDGIKIRGPVITVCQVQGRNGTTGDEQHGALMCARNSSGELVFWLRGSSKDYVLRKPDGTLITNQVEAKKRAEELIANNAVTL